MLTSVSIFESPNYTWSGVLSELTATDIDLFSFCAAHSIARILQHCIGGGVDVPGIANFSAHIGVWAVEKHLHLMVKFRRTARVWVKELYKLQTGDRANNIVRVAAALQEGQLVRSPLIVIIMMQLFFFTGHQSLGWEFQLLSRDIPEVVLSAQYGEFNIILWSVRIPRSIVPRTMMVVRIYFCISFFFILSLCSTPDSPCTYGMDSG